jgi:UDP-glucose 4-epimerase
MVARFLNLAAKGEILELLPSTEDKINLIHASDVAEAMLQALEKEAWGTFNIASGSLYSIREIAETCVKVVKKGKIRVLAGDVNQPPKTRFDLSCEAARQAFGFSPKLDLYSGIQRMWQEKNPQQEKMSMK